MKLSLDITDLDLFVFSTAAIEASEFTAKKVYGTEEVKKTPEGRQLFSARNIIFLDSSGEHEQGITLSILTPVKLEAMKSYKFVGPVICTPWTNNGRVAYSLIAESLEPITVTPEKKNA